MNGLRLLTCSLCSGNKAGEIDGFFWMEGSHARCCYLNAVVWKQDYLFIYLFI